MGFFYKKKPIDYQLIINFLYHYDYNMSSLLNIQSELKAPKDLTNKFGGYKYRSCESILEELKPILKKYSCELTISDELVNIWERYYIKATVTLQEEGKPTISVCWYAREEESKKWMDGSQITGASSSYARKYALNGLFLIDDAKDSDATNDGGNNNKKELSELGTILKDKIMKVTTKAELTLVSAEITQSKMNWQLTTDEISQLQTLYNNIYKSLSV